MAGLNELWLPIPDFVDYEASDFGNVRSLDRWVEYADGRRRFYFGQLLKPRRSSSGHLSVQLPRIGSIFIHHAVLRAHVGECPEGQECLHADDVPSNNVLTNLSWGTRSQNQLDRVRNGLNPNANKTHCDSGHEYTEANTYRPPGRNRRVCRECIRIWQRVEWKQSRSTA